MKTLKEPQEPFCPPFPLPLSPLSRRRVALRFVRSINNSFFLSSRDLMMSVFCPDSLSLLQNNQKESQRLLFSDQKAQKAPLSSTKTVERKISLCVFSFCCEPTAGIRIKKIRKYLNRN